MRFLSVALLLTLAGACVTTRPVGKTTVLFLCPHGGAKSVIAASYFNRLAADRELPYLGMAAAAEEPYDAVPAPVAEFLKSEGFDVHTFKPRRVEAEEMKNASRVVSIDCHLEGLNFAGVTVERWDDVPRVSVDLDASAAAIRRRVEALMEELRGRH